MTACDYAEFYERQYRPRRRLRRLAARLVWGALFLVRPRLTLRIWRERESLEA